MVDVKTGEGICYYSGKVYDAASTIKGPYVATICRTRPGSVTSSVKSTMSKTIKISSNAGYTTLYNRFSRANTRRAQSYSHTSFSTSQWTRYSPRTLAKLWVGNYWYFFKDTNSKSEWCRKLYLAPKMSFIHAALKENHTTYTKPGWNGATWDDAGVVHGDNGTYIVAIMTTNRAHTKTQYPLVRALDAVHDDMVKTYNERHGLLDQPEESEAA